MWKRGLEKNLECDVIKGDDSIGQKLPSIKFRKVDQRYDGRTTESNGRFRWFSCVSGVLA
jgi:hypothetical protein